jgi:hypothetical protein
MVARDLVTRRKGSARSSGFDVLLRAMVLAAALFVAGSAAAGVPTPQTCTIPSHVVLVGTDAGGVPDALGAFSVVVRRFDVVVPGSQVWVDFSESPHLKLCSVQPSPGLYLVCGPVPQGVVGSADMTGTITLRLVGRADRSAPDPQAASLRIYADGVLLGTVRVSAFDQDGGGVGATDIAAWIDDHFHLPNASRSDFDGDGTVGAEDLSLLLDAHFRSGSILECAAAYCSQP